MTRVKICGLTNSQDVAIAVEAGAHALGFVLEPSSPRYLTDHGVPRDVPPYVARFAVYGPFHAPAPDWADAVQSLDDPGAERWTMAVRLRLDDDPVQVAKAAEASGAQALLLDAFSEAAYGGTGLRVDIGLARAVVEATSLPVVLAGGLDPQNVAQAIKAIRPFAVDVSGGVEREKGIKDHDKVRAFVREALGA